MEWLNKHRFAGISIFPSSWKGRGKAGRWCAVLTPRLTPVDFWEQHSLSSWLLLKPSALEYKAGHCLPPPNSFLFVPRILLADYRCTQGGGTLDSHPTVLFLYDSKPNTHSFFLVIYYDV